MKWLLLTVLFLLPVEVLAGEDPPVEPKPLAYEGPPPPFKARRRVGVGHMKAKGQGLIDLKRWPPEPDPPPLKDTDPERLAQALRRLCHDWMPPSRPRRYATWILEYAARFQVDPFTLAALVYRSSRCLPRMKDNFGEGLTMLNLRMHAPYLQKRVYRYWVLEQGAWVEKEKALPDYGWVRGSMRKARVNLYFAAALLSIHKEQCPRNDGAFGSMPHRHHVSHFVYGDRVMGAGPEDRILRSRRRLLEYYNGVTPREAGKFGELTLLSPLDGLPRKVTSGMGRDRSEGARRHKGLDLASTHGEPVYTVADGRISHAGLDRPGRGPLSLEPEEALTVKPSEMGAGGLFVMIRHFNSGGLISAYMHLSAYVVKTGDKVRAGQLIGYVGRTGIKQSGAHLHFELRHKGRHIDPMKHLNSAFFPPEATYRGNMIIKVERRERRRRRIRLYRERAKAKAGPSGASLSGKPAAQ